jgi:chromatin remodeling complex protein RSC6
MSDTLEESFNTVCDSLALFKMQLSTIQQQIRTIEKQVKKELKTNKKPVKVKTATKKAPSGFAKPTKVTKELCEFMNRPEGTEIARTEVTKTLVQYIKTNNLQEQTAESKNKIVPDDKLKNLLGLNENEENDLTFFNIQKHMNKHFLSKKKEQSAATASEVSL